MSDKKTRLKAAGIRINWVAQELGDVAFDIYNGNANRILDPDKFRSLAKTLVDIKKTIDGVLDD